MRKILIILFISIYFDSQSQTRICGQNVCIDTLYFPLTSFYLIARATSTDTIIYRGWSFISGPTTVPPELNKDSALVTFTIPGQYIFKYTVNNSKGASYTGTDMVTVIGITTLSTQINFMNGSTQSVQPIKNIIIKKSDGSTKTVTP